MDFNQMPVTRKFWKLYDQDTVLVFDENAAPRPVYKLTGVSASVWRLCDGNHTLHDITAVLAADYGVTLNQLKDDVIGFVLDLERRGLIAWIGDCPRPFRVLLIDPPAADPAIIGEGPKEPSIGLAYIAAVLAQENVETRILDLRRIPLTWQELLNRALRESDPHIVGITSMSPTFRNASHIAYHVKQALPQRTIVFGGHHVTFEYREVLEQNAWIDAVVLGEGEQTMRELVNRLRCGGEIDDTIRGIAFRRRGEVAVSRPREFIKDLDSLPFPEPYSITMNPEPYATARILSSRGCPFSCKFCSEAGFYNQTVRYRSPRNVVDEVELKYNKYRFRQFMFSDDLFLLNLDRVTQICAEIKSRNLQIEWACNTRVDTAPRAVFEAMYDAGCRALFVGVESADGGVLRAMDKRSRIENVIKGIKLARSIGLKVSAGFIIGHPGETKQTIRKSIALARELELDDFAFTFLNVYPGTDLHKNFEGHRLRYVGAKSEYSLYHPVVETDEFTAADATEAYLDMCDDLRGAYAGSAIPASVV